MPRWRRAADATPLEPLMSEPLTDASITVGPDEAYYMTGTAVRGGAAAFARQVAIWRSADMRHWTEDPHRRFRAARALARDSLL